MTNPAGAKLSDRLWAAATGTYEKILDHPFSAGLTDGDLDRAAFRHFVLQDDHLMHSYVRSLSVLAARSPDMAVRRDLGVADDVAAAEPVGPTTLAYLNFLRAATYGEPFPEALGAMLPCYWMSGGSGKALTERSSPDPLYARFIKTYAGEDFARFAEEVLAVTDRIGADLTERERDRVQDRFETAARYEWMFWDAAYRREQWPL